MFTLSARFIFGADLKTTSTCTADTCSTSTPTNLYKSSHMKKLIVLQLQENETQIKPLQFFEDGMVLA
jgi:hypothetical protein